MARSGDSEFEAFARDAMPRLVRAFAAVRGADAPQAAPEAIAYAWEHWSEIDVMENPRSTRMLDVEEQLRRYGDAVESHFLRQDGEVPIARPPARRRAFLVGAAAFVLILSVSVAVIAGSREEPSKVATLPAARAGE